MNTRDKEVLNMQLTLIPILARVWNKSSLELSDMFTKYDVLGYIDVCYEKYNSTGNQGIIDDLKEYIDLLPIPVLDGGHIMIALIEIAIRRPVPTKLVQPVTYFFMFVLISFMAIVSFFDVKKMLPPRWSNALEINIHRASSELEDDAETAASPETEVKTEAAETQAQQEASGETAGE